MFNPWGFVLVSGRLQESMLKSSGSFPFAEDAYFSYNLESLPWDLNFFSTHLAFCPLWVPCTVLDDQDVAGGEWTIRIHPQWVQPGEVVFSKKNEIRVSPLVTRV